MVRDGIVWNSPFEGFEISNWGGLLGQLLVAGPLPLGAQKTLPGGVTIKAGANCGWGPSRVWDAWATSVDPMWIHIIDSCQQFPAQMSCILLAASWHVMAYTDPMLPVVEPQLRSIVFGEQDLVDGHPLELDLGSNDSTLRESMTWSLSWHAPHEMPVGIGPLVFYSSDIVKCKL